MLSGDETFEHTHPPNWSDRKMQTRLIAECGFRIVATATRSTESPQKPRPTVMISACCLESTDLRGCPAPERDGSTQTRPGSSSDCPSVGWHSGTCVCTADRR